MAKRLPAILGVLLLLLARPAPLLAQTDKEPPRQRVVIYMIDKLNLSDLDPDVTPCLWQMRSEGGSGLLNPLSAGGRTDKNVACTISAGEPALGSLNADLNFKSAEMVNCERAGDAFFRNTGFLPVDCNVVVSSVEAIKRNNEKRGLGQPGKLGEELHALGLKTAVIGNADLPGDCSRGGALIVMDANGIVDNGLVGGEMVNKSADFPPSSNYAGIAEAFRQFQAYDVVLVQFGDLARLDKMNGMYSDERLRAERRNRLTQVDACISQLQKELNGSDTAYVISLTPSHEAALEGEFLTPVIINGPGVKDVLTSFSTRREGVVASVSLKNSILHCFDPAVPDPVYTSRADNVMEDLKDLNRRVAFEHLNQSRLVTVYIALIFLLMLAALALRWKKTSPAWADFLVLFALAVPLSLLLMGNLEVFDHRLFLLVSLGVNLSLCVLCLLASRMTKSSALGILMFLTIGAIALDLVFDLGMLKQSIFSYRIMSGSRYYGLGNEYMGVLVGSTIGLSAMALQYAYSKRRLFIAALLFSLMVFLIAYPLFGINVGGSITACIGLGYTYMRYSNYKINLARVFWLACGIMVLISIMAAIDLQYPPELQSHLGRNVNLVRDSGGGEILNIISRKVQMQLRVINYSVWGWGLLYLVLFFSYHVFRPAGIMKRVATQTPVVFGGMQGIIAAALVAIVFNDSGITAAAVLALYFSALYIKYLPSENP